MQTAMDRQQGKVERFLKLGYSHADIMRVLDSLRHDAQTNDILEELIKTCQKSTSSTVPTYTSANGHCGANGVPSGTAKTSRASSSSPQLVARGCSPPRTVSPARSPTPLDRYQTSNFRPVVIDGSNVAMSHGNKQVFSCRGVQLAVKWFWNQGMRDITVFVPLWRKEQPRPETPITDQHILTDLERKKILVFTPSRCVNGKRIVCYDDRYIINLAYESDGIIVSNDNYRDLQIEKPQWKKFIEERLLMYTFVNDTFMPPEDPLGRNGPTLDNFLRKRPTAPENKQQPCPYGKKCTYGLKCKYYHPERADQSQLSVADELRAKSKSAIEQEQALHQASITASSTLHPYAFSLGDTGLGYSCSSYFPGMGQEGRSSPVLRSNSPRDRRSPANMHSSLRSYNNAPSTDSDHGFGSLDSKFSRMLIQESLPHQYQPAEAQHDRSMASSGVGSSSHVSEGFYSSSGHRLTPEVSEHFDHPQNAGMGLHAPECCYNPTVPRGAYPPLDSLFPPSPHLYGHVTALPHADYFQGAGNGAIHLSLEDPRHPKLRSGVCRSLGDTRWGLTMGELEGMAAVGGGTSSFDEKREVIRARLSNIYPPSTVDHVMRHYPHVQDMAQLVTLLQKHKTSY